MPISGFRAFWLAQSTSQLAEHSTSAVLPLLAVLTLDVTAPDLGLLRAAGQAPLLLLPLLAGAWVDRRPGRGVMVLADVGRALILTAAAAAAFLGRLDVPLLLVTAFAVGALSVFFDVAYQGFLVRLTDRDHLLPAVGRIEGARSAAQMAGPALGGALVSALSAPLAAASAALVFGVSAVSLTRIGNRFAAPAGRTRIRDGVAFVARDPLLRTICVVSGAFHLSLAAAMTLYLLYLPRTLGLSAASIGLVLAATGPGALLGSVLAARLPRRFGYGPVIVVAAFAGDGVMLVVPALPGGGGATVAALIAVNLVFGTFGQVVNITVMAVRQSVTPDSLQGRVAATITFAGMGLAPVGSLVGGLLGGQLGLRPALMVAAAGLLLSPVLMLLSPLARVGRVTVSG
ncbi:MFS transporter [Paractinoplanes hotanensis]|uniref:MFS transporter n=1 Tax=Paractinoplanes hotanensis TaxID=2906497 RepID=A0ABT0Y9A1_9ACTN|nr:MFS transporter [Actinoplanes hotanensis]MCM4082627.1 MFS transporter [Actinoplanes hotanensis]